MVSGWWQLNFLTSSSNPGFRAPLRRRQDGFSNPVVASGEGRGRRGETRSELSV